MGIDVSSLQVKASHYSIWRAVCFKIIFVSCTISLSLSLCFLFRDTVVWTYSLSVVRITLSVVSCTGYKLSVINLHSVDCTHSSVAVSCNSIYSVGCTHYSLGTLSVVRTTLSLVKFTLSVVHKTLSVVCTTLSVLCPLYALLSWL